MVDLYKDIEKLLDEGKPLYPRQIRSKVGNPDKARLMGYLQCLVDLRRIKSNKQGPAIVFYK